ncbi:MAG: toxin-antitoxin system HicB family antitoxin [Methylobacillus sp.]|jgi:antitoxin HicB|nr:toxin-antitoxin system HicB family antitoxin [Methylobacillus sp.]
MKNLDDYPFEIRPLSQEDGGGYLIAFPDFNTCISDGDTIEETIANGRAALTETIEALQGWGMPIPEPGSGGTASGKFITRIPKSLHAALSVRAKNEGVSLNTLVLSFLAEGVGKAMHQHGV